MPLSPTCRLLYFYVFYINEQRTSNNDGGFKAIKAKEVTGKTSKQQNTVAKKDHKTQRNNIEVEIPTLRLAGALKAFSLVPLCLRPTKAKVSATCTV